MFDERIMNPAAGMITQTISYTDTAGTSLLWAPGANAVQIMCTSAAYVKVGSGDADTTSTPIPASRPVTFKVPTGIAWTVSAVRVSGNGSVIAKPLAN